MRRILETNVAKFQTLERLYQEGSIQRDILSKQLKEAREKSDALDKKHAELQRKYEDCKRHYIELKHKNGETAIELGKLKGDTGNRNEQSADINIKDKYESLKGKYKVILIYIV